jgi:hypothetical protein
MSDCALHIWSQNRNLISDETNYLMNMSNYEDDLCVLPHVGPETQENLRNEGYGSFTEIARATPWGLASEVGVGLSHTSEIINSAVAELSCSCPMCKTDNISPIWGGYPGGKLDEELKNTKEFFCLDCMWVGMFADVHQPSEDITVGAQKSVEAALTP